MPLNKTKQNRNNKNKKPEMRRKTTVRILKTTNWGHLTREEREPPHKKKEIEFILMVAQNNAKITNYVKAKIDNKQQDSKYRFGGDRD